MFSKVALLILSMTFSSLAYAKETVNRGDFGTFERSLSKKDYAYQIIQDPTGKAPTPKVEKFQVKFGDCSVSKTWNDCETDRERSELSEKGRTNREKVAVWYGWSFYLPEPYPLIFPAKVALGQFHQDQGSPLWMFQQLDSGLVLEATFLPEPKQFPLITWEMLKGRWQKIEMEVYWTPAPNGFLRVWVNDELKVDYQGPTKEKSNIYFKYGLYRSFLSRYKTATGKKELPEQEVYYSNVKRAKNRKGLHTNG